MPDTVNAPQLSAGPLSRATAGSWIPLTKSWLQFRNLFWVVDPESTARPATLDAAGIDQAEREVRFHLFNCLSPEDAEIMDTHGTCAQVWAAITKKYAKKEDISSLEERLERFTCADYDDVRSAWDCLTYIAQRKSTLEGDQTAIKTDRLFEKLGRTIPGPLKQTWNWLSISPSLSTEAKIEMLEKTEKNIGGFRTDQAHAALNNFKSRSQGSSSRRDDVVCYYCEKKGHFKRNCPEWKDICDKIIKARKSRGKPVEIANSSTTDAAGKLSPSDWIVDSGASTHMTDKLDFFSGSLKPVGTRFVKAGGGLLTADRVGSVRIIDKNATVMLIHNVLYVPGLNVNLLSLKELASKGFIGQLTADGLTLFNSTKGATIGCHSVEGVYVLDSISTEQIHAHAVPRADPGYLHRVFGHLGMDTVKSILQATDHNHGEMSGKAQMFCETCYDLDWP